MEHELVEAFVQWQRSRGRGKSCLRCYRCALTEYRRYLEAAGVGSFCEPSAEVLRRYYAAVRQRGLSQTTVYKKLHAVSSFYAWLKATGRILYDPSPTPPKRGSGSLPRTMPSPSIIARMYRQAPSHNDTLAFRDYVIADLAYTCGLRRGELHRLNVQDVHIGDGVVAVKGKGGDQRIVPIGSRCLEGLVFYSHRIRPRLAGGNAAKAVFLRREKGRGRLGTAGIARAVTRMRRRLGVKEYFCVHGLRHACATGLLRNGAALQDVSRMLGHAKLATTQIYTHLAPYDLKRHHARYHPRG